MAKRTLDQNRLAIRKGNKVLNLLTGEVLAINSKNAVYDLTYDKGFTFKNANDIKSLSQIDVSVKQALTSGGWKVEKVSSLGLKEEKKGLWANIHAKRERGEKPAKPGEKGYPKTLDIEEKAVSQQQQKFMGMALAYKRGELNNASLKVKQAAASMSEKELKDFAKTKHEGLPVKSFESFIVESPSKRGRPSKSNKPDHIFVQLMKAQDVGGNFEIQFRRGKGKLDKNEVDVLVKLYQGLKPREKRMFRAVVKDVSTAKKTAAVLLGK